MKFYQILRETEGTMFNKEFLYWVKDGKPYFFEGWVSESGSNLKQLMKGVRDGTIKEIPDFELVLMSEEQLKELPPIPKLAFESSHI